MTLTRSAAIRAFLLAVFLCPVTAVAATEQADELASIRQLLEAQQAQIASLQEAVASQQLELNRQRNLIASIQGSAPETATRVAAVTDDPPTLPPPSTAEDVALQSRLADLERRLSEVPEDPHAAMTDPSFPGSWPLPGTTASLRIGGYVKMNIVDSFDPLVTRDRFIVGTIPPDGVIVEGADQQFSLNGEQSRVNLDLRDHTELGDLRAFVEGDFAGAGSTFRLRHAFGQFRKMLAGQTWSTLMDLDSSPEELDFEGINGRINARQPQLRFFPTLGNKLNLKVALEDPRPDVSGGTGVSDLPDFVIGVDNVALGMLGWMDRQQGWNVRGALIGRQISARPFDIGEKKKVMGWGITASGRIPIGLWSERDHFLWQLNYGEGIGRYINDLGTIGGQDAIFAPNGDLKALPVFAGYLSYQHWWSNRWRSNATFSWVDVDTYDFQSTPAYIEQFGAPYQTTLRSSINVLFNPVKRLEVGAELLWGERQNADNTKGSASQIQLAARYLY